MAVLVFLAWAGNRISQSAVTALSEKIDPSALHWHLVRYAVRIGWALFLVMGLVETVPVLNNMRNMLVASSSVVIAAIGLASQDVLKNAIDGIVISVFKPFAVGDRVRLVNRGLTGTVEDISFRCTAIRTVENNLLLIPNSVMNTEIVENDNIMDTRIKAFLDVTVGYDSDISMVKALMTEIVTSDPLFVDTRSDEAKEAGAAPVSVLVRNLGESGIEMRATVCAANINDSFVLCSNLREQVLVKFRENGITIPYKTVTIDGSTGPRNAGHAGTTPKRRTKGGNGG